MLFNFLRQGLPERNSKGKKIIIVGAGISGLTAGYLLKKAGHNVVILEASNRAGGRIQTYRSLIFIKFYSIMICFDGTLACPRK